MLSPYWQTKTKKCKQNNSKQYFYHPNYVATRIEKIAMVELVFSRKHGSTLSLQTEERPSYGT